MRLAGKRLRYTLELFRPCYGPGLDQRLTALKDLQDSLGDVNDAVASGALLAHRIGHKARHFLQARAEEKAAEFRKQWTKSFELHGAKPVDRVFGAERKGSREEDRLMHAGR